MTQSDFTVSAMIAVPSALMASALRTFVNTINGVEVTAQAADFAAALQVLAEWRPHLLVLDADLAAGDLAECLGSFLQIAPELCIITLVNNHRQRTIALGAGAAHALLKGNLNEQLRAAIMPDSP